MSAPKALPLTVSRMRVQQGRLVCDVRIDNPQFRYTTSSFMKHVVPEHPHLPRHACVNAEGNTFSAVMNKTPLPHLLEHLVIDYQVRESSENTDVTSTFVGTSEWICEQKGTARVAVSFTDDLVALRAFQNAAQFLNQTVLRYAHDFSSSNI